jgi:hypothetical protein
VRQIRIEDIHREGSSSMSEVKNVELTDKLRETALKAVNDK